MMTNNPNKYRFANASLALCILFSMSACAQLSKTERGAATGAGAGAVLGGVIGKTMGETSKGAVLGAVLGGTAGAIIGQRMDRQARDLEQDLEGADVERVGEGIIVSFDSGILFDFNSSILKEEARRNLARLASSLTEHSGTEILIVGHTDSKGSADYNMSLSLERAGSAVSFLRMKGVSSKRINRDGRGEYEPISTNDSEAGRQENRRVEIAIFASEDARKDAKNQSRG